MSQLYFVFVLVFVFIHPPPFASLPVGPTSSTLRSSQRTTSFVACSACRTPTSRDLRRPSTGTRLHSNERWVSPASQVTRASRAGTLRPQRARLRRRRARLQTVARKAAAEGTAAAVAAVPGHAPERCSLYVTLPSVEAVAAAVDAAAAAERAGAPAQQRQALQRQRQEQCLPGATGCGARPSLVRRARESSGGDDAHGGGRRKQCCNI